MTTLQDHLNDLVNEVLENADETAENQVSKEEIIERYLDLIKAEFTAYLS